MNRATSVYGTNRIHRSKLAMSALRGEARPRRPPRALAEHPDRLAHQRAGGPLRPGATARRQCRARGAQDQARLAELGGVILPGSPTDFGKLIADDTEKWSKVIKFSGAKPESYSITFR